MVTFEQIQDLCPWKQVNEITKSFDCSATAKVNPCGRVVFKPCAGSNCAIYQMLKSTLKN